MKPAVYCVVLLNLVLLFIQCRLFSASEDSDTVVARVNQSSLTVDELESEMESAALSAPTLQMRKEWVSDWVRTELLYQEALRRDFDNDGNAARELKRMRRDYLASAVLEQIVADSSLLVTDEEVAAYFEAHLQEFIYHEPELRLSVIVLPDIGKARQVRNQLARGRGTFEEFARTQSIHPSSSNGGDLGFLKRAEISDVSVQNIVFSLKTGHVSRPVLSESGSFIFRVDDRRETGALPPLDEVRDEIVNRVLRERRRELVRVFVEELRQGADVAIFDGNLMRSETVAP